MYLFIYVERSWFDFYSTFTWNDIIRWLSNWFICFCLLILQFHPAIAHIFLH